MVRREASLKFQRQQNDYLILKKFKTINRRSKKDSEKQALYSLDNLLITTFFSIVLTTILAYSTYIPKALSPFFVVALLLVFIFTFRGIAEDNIKYRIYAWMVSFWYDIPIFFTLASLFFPFEQTFANYRSQYIQIINIIFYLSIFLILSYFNSRIMNYIIEIYKRRTSILSKQVIERITSSEGYHATFGFNKMKFFLLGLILLIGWGILFISINKILA